MHGNISGDHSTKSPAEALEQDVDYDKFVNIS